MPEQSSTPRTLDTPMLEQLRADAGALRASFVAAADEPRSFAATFYARLFELAPQARALFPTDMQAQQDKFAQTLGTIVAFIDDPAKLVAGLRQLGARHLAYGAQPGHYAPVGEALLWTLEQRSDGGLPPEARVAWRRVYGWIVAEMLSGTRS